MLGRLILYTVIGIMILPLLFNIYFYFVEKDMQENPVSKNSATEVAFADGKSLYAARCSSCHGANGDGAGGYPRVNGESATAIAAKLIGYKSGSYGSTAKGVMMLQIQDISRSQVDQVARYLSKLTPVLQEHELKKLEEIELDDYDTSS